MECNDSCSSLLHLQIAMLLLLLTTAALCALHPLLSTAVCILVYVMPCLMQGS
jgi:hypothetical protein